MKKRCIALAFLMLAGLTGAQAQDYPTRPVTVIVPFAPGGPADVTGRIVADIFSRHLGQQFVVENVGGAGGTLGSLRVAHATPDGYTLLMVSSTQTVNETLYANKPYRLLGDLGWRRMAWNNGVRQHDLRARPLDALRR